MINSRAGSGTFEDGSRAIVETQGLLRKPGSDIFGPGDPDHDIGLLDAELEIAARQIFDHGPLVGWRRTTWPNLLIIY